LEAIANQESLPTSETSLAGSRIRSHRALLVALVVVIGCSGDDKPNQIVWTKAEAAGSNCAHGGIRIDSGLDTSGDGTLDASEIDSTVFVCSDSNGSDGAEALVDLVPESPGANCVNGGVAVHSGLDNGDGGATARDGVLGAGEIDNTTFICATPTAPKTVPLVHLKFNGDLVNDGSVGGSGTGGVTGFVTDRCGSANSAASFNVNSVTTPSVTLGGAAFTFSAWVRTTDTSSFNGIIAQPNPTAPGLGQMYIHSSLVQSEMINANTTSLSSKSNVADDTWHHIVMTFDAATHVHAIYVDAVEEAKATNNGDHSYTGGIFIGQLRDVPGSYTGFIDNARVYDSALSAQEISRLYAFERATCAD
jgi:hypothetical protein